MTHQRFNEVGQAFDDFFNGIDAAKDAVATLEELMTSDGYVSTADSIGLMSQLLRSAIAALNDAEECLVGIEPCEDVFDDEAGDESDDE